MNDSEKLSTLGIVSLSRKSVALVSLQLAAGMALLSLIVAVLQPAKEIANDSILTKVGMCAALAIIWCLVNLLSAYIIRGFAWLIARVRRPA